MTSILGRDSELASISAFLERARSRPCALIVEGAAGIGKTSVWQFALERAVEMRFRVLATRATEAESDLSYVALGDVVGPLVDEGLAVLPPPQRAALEIALLRADVSGDPPDERAVALAALEVVTAAAERDPLVVAVDDLQWLDRASARVLNFVLRRATARLGVLATFRLHAGDDPVAIDRAIATGDVEHLPIGPLPVETMERVIHARLGAAIPHPVAVRITDAAGGNPFFVLEIARGLAGRSAPGPGEVLPIPENLLDLVEERLETLPAETRGALLIAAVASRPTERLIAETGTLSATDALRAAEVAGIVAIEDGRVVFVHPLFASAISASATAGDLRDAHRRIASAVEDPEQRARHLALSSIGPDPSVADVLDRAADHARARGAPSSAAELGELARRLTPPSDAEALRRRTVTAADHHFNAGNAPRAWALLQEAIDATEPGIVRAELRFRLATITWMDVDRVDALCREALAETEPDDVDLRSAILEHLAWVGIYRGDLSAAAASATEAVRNLDAVADPMISADSRATSAMVGFLEGRPAAATLEVSERERDVSPLEQPSTNVSAYTPPRAMHGLMLIWSGELEAARDVLLEELAEYERGGRYLFRDEILGYLAELEWRAGRWELAQRYADESLDIVIESGRTLAVGSDLVYSKALVVAHLGDEVAARELASEGVALSRRNGDALNVHRNEAVLGSLELALANPVAALEHLEPVVAFLREFASPEPGVIPFVPDAIEALVSSGRLEDADTLLAEHEAKGRRQGRPWALATAERCRALIMAGTGDVGGATSAIDRALALHADVPQPFDLARTRLVEGEIARRARAKRRSREALTEALGTFEELGATLWSARAHAALERVTGTAAGPGKLTPTERRIAEAVAEGKTNREVAAELFISVKTVEANLSRVFHKLGVRSRAELIRSGAAKLAGP